MKTKGPENIFSFYEELVSGGTGSLADDFYAESQEIEYYTKEGPKKNRVYIEGLGHYNQRDYFALCSKYQSREVLNNMESLLLESSHSGKIKILLAKYYNDLDYYTSKLRESPLSKEYPFFVSDLEEAKTDSPMRMKYLEQHAETSQATSKEEEGDKPIPGQSSSKNPSSGYKLKWLANNNVLFTLFYDLFYGQDRGPAIIEAPSVKVLQDFIINNFVDRDGQPFSKLSVETSFSKTKIKKRVGNDDRVDLRRVKVKKDIE